MTSDIPLGRYPQRRGVQIQLTLARFPVRSGSLVAAAKRFTLLEVNDLLQDLILQGLQIVPLDMITTTISGHFLDKFRPAVIISPMLFFMS